MYTLVIGNRNYSSWSLRAWLYLRLSDIAFDVVRIPLFTADWRERIDAYGAAGRVPILLDGDLRIWDSLAIMAHLEEAHPSALGWPAEPSARALARSISAEMHSGFMALRDELPQNLRVRRLLERGALSAACQDQIERVTRLWGECRERHGAGGDGLFGAWSIADVMYAPVALRFATYELALDDEAARYVRSVQSLPAIEEWVQAAKDELEHLDFIDARTPAEDSPLTLA